VTEPLYPRASHENGGRHRNHSCPQWKAAHTACMGAHVWIDALVSALEEAFLGSVASVASVAAALDLGPEVVVQKMER